MTQIFFYSDIGTTMLQDPAFRALANWHAVPNDDGTCYGVVLPHGNVDPNAVADRLTELGLHPLPSVHDLDTDPPPGLMKGLAKHGVKQGDKAKDVAKKMHAATGCDLFRPNFY